MATLLNGVNAVLVRTKIIQGDSGTLTSLTDSGRQGFIDIAVQIWNEVIEELYSATSIPLPQEMAEDTITLVTDTRSYALQSDLIQLRFPLLDETNGQFIAEYRGGYEQMVADQPYPANYTGLPYLGAISPVNSELYLDRIPTSDENGRVYKYRYDKDISMSAAADTFPFTDAVYRALIPAAAQLWNRDQKRSFDEAVFKTSVGRASRFLTKIQPRTSWLPLHEKIIFSTDPLE